MKKIFFLLLLSGLSITSFAQYGRLEPLRQGDSTHLVLRTPQETLEKLAASPDKEIRKTGSQIETVERQLELWRSIYLTGRMPSRDLSYFVKILQSLAKKGIGVNYYTREAMIYSTSPPGGAY
ncbi:hypothetical protein ACFSJU_12695 [Paradesertivirga mongoliensis]|uniref:Uncharacterized protein n=1 Tax=Paradesertivirga mongoliensis TaxID=2100740 RepID=A0ABW4ZN44_9SPHI|nr:hypothetical protein [Pedobacter mongoliensis]